MLHSRSFALLLRTQQKLESGIRSLECVREGTAKLEESGKECRHVGGAIITRVVPVGEEKEHGHVGIDVWILCRTGFFSARVAQHHWLRFVQRFLVELCCWLRFVWRKVIVLMLFHQLGQRCSEAFGRVQCPWLVFHLLHISC